MLKLLLSCSPYITVLLFTLVLTGCESFKNSISENGNSLPDDKEYNEIANKWDIFDFSGKQKKAKSASALLKAVVENQKDIVKLLIEKGADINVKDKNGWTALIWAIHYGNLDIAEYLIKKGADINLKTKDGETALSLSITRGYTDIAKLLINKGADVNKKLKAQPNALCLAISEKRINLAKLILNKKIFLAGAPRGNEFPLKISLTRTDKKNNNIRQVIEQTIKNKNQAIAFYLVLSPKEDTPGLLPYDYMFSGEKTITDNNFIPLEEFLKDYSSKMLLYIVIPHNMQYGKFRKLSDIYLNIITKNNNSQSVITASQNLQFLRYLRNKNKKIFLCLHSQQKEINLNIIELLRSMQLFAYTMPICLFDIETIKNLHKAGIMSFVIIKNKNINKTKYRKVLDIADGIIR